jgi:isoleucyl-tRNA synthetase
MRSEEEVLGFWARKKVFLGSIKKRSRGGKRFVFFEGPPYANGKPGIHHVEARSFKDVVVRYKTLRGYFVERRAGWDTHGLPTEMAVEKKLGVKSKKDIEEKIGIQKFVREARNQVFFYKAEWERLTERMGYWLDFEKAYVTMDNEYIESLWWIISEFWKKKYLYEAEKVVPWCVRCGTALSSHELAQGYKKVKEQSVIVRFRVRTRRASLLVWTTTPWTLPANVAAAVDPDGEYVTVDDRGEKLILLKERAESFFPDLKPLWEEKGENLVGLEYEPPYFGEGNPYKIVGADYVTHDEGTGIVHISPAFGEEDMDVAKKEDLPVYLTIDEEGRFTDAVGAWKGIFVKDADPQIIKDLSQKGFLWKQMPYEHDYPFCWRCDTPLIYMARRSWWVKVKQARAKLVEANKGINWYPDYLKQGRFGGWIKEAKDWALSRERFWGTPLPIWKCNKCDNVAVAGSLKELSDLVDGSGNTYYLLRHGYAKSNELDIGVADPVGDKYGLLQKGKTEAKHAAQKLKKAKIDLIIASDLLRTKETAEIVSSDLGIPVEFDNDLREMGFGDYEKKSSKIVTGEWTAKERLTKKLPGKDAESYNDLKVRGFNLFKRLESKYKKKNILLVGHGAPLYFLEGVILGITEPDGVPNVKIYKNSDIHKLIPLNAPRNERGELDLHKPYIDELKTKCKKCEEVMERTPEVVDVWFDSGAMPYAAWHYPFENKERIDKKLSYPADYIAEAIDQLRGWFYVMLVESVLLGKGAPYKNVLSLGHVLDTSGKKMSKSRGNVVDPIKLFDEYGADAVRWYFFTVNQPEDSKLFDVKDIVRAKRGFLDLLTNSLKFYELYDKGKKTRKKHILDVWIVSRLTEVSEDIANKMDSYNIVGAARSLEKFVAEDISRWYVRRSRERMRNGEGVDILGNVLKQVSILSSAFVPFTSEILYRALGGKQISVHLEDWPKKGRISKKLLEDMAEVRQLAALGLELRARAGIKIRQPLASFSIQKTNIKDSKILEVLEEELNVKTIMINPKLSETVMLDTKISDELRQEGEEREIIRQVQDLRKQAGLHPSDTIELSISGEIPDESLPKIKKGARISKIVLVDAKADSKAPRVGKVILHSLKKL